MERKYFYVAHFINASQEIYPDNTQAAFTRHLAQPFDLGTSSDWEVGACEITHKPRRRQIFNGVVVEFISEVNALIYCDLIAPQFVGKDIVRVLRSIILWPILGKHLFQNIYYLPVEKSEFQDIHIKIKRLDCEPPEFEDIDAPVKIVLHFRRV